MRGYNYKILVGGGWNTHFRNEIAFHLRESHGYENVLKSKGLDDMAKAAVEEDAQSVIFSASKYDLDDIRDMISDFRSRDALDINILCKLFDLEDIGSPTMRGLDRTFNMYSSTEDISRSIMEIEWQELYGVGEKSAQYLAEKGVRPDNDYESWISTLEEHFSPATSRSIAGKVLKNNDLEEEYLDLLQNS